MDDFPFSAEPWLYRVRAGDFSAIPADLRWDDTHPGFADLLGDLHRHRARLGLPKPQVLIAKNFEVAKRTGRWPGSALEMWATLQASTQGPRIRVCGPMPRVVSETSGLPDPLTEPTKDETSAQTAGLF